MSEPADDALVLTIVIGVLDEGTGQAGDGLTGNPCYMVPPPMKARISEVAGISLSETGVK